MVELAKPTVLDKRYVREGIMAFNYDAILAEREAWQKEIDELALENRKLVAVLDKSKDAQENIALWRKVAAFKRADKREFRSIVVALETAEKAQKQVVELQAALDKEVVRADCLLKALKTTENILSDTKAALDKAETKYAASSTAADELLDNWKHRADKAEATVATLTRLNSAQAKVIGKYQALEGALKTAIDKSLPKEARQKK